MHRLPLILGVPTIFWNRSIPECTLFERTLNKANVEEMDTFLNILETQTKSYQKESVLSAAEKLRVVQELLSAKEEAENVAAGIRLLNMLVLRIPKEAPELAVALRIRGIWLFKHSYFEGAVNDFLMFLHLKPEMVSYEDLYEVNGNLIICYYLMRQYKKAKQYLRSFKKYKDKLTSAVILMPNFRKMDDHISKFADELDNIEDLMPKFVEDAFVSVPFNGFNTSEDIPHSSAACAYINEKVASGIYSNCNIPYGSIVLVENPTVYSINMPFVQCEYCFRMRSQSYTCLECRYKTYCSLACLERDKALHQNECIGYRTLILLILDATSLFRIFMGVSALLHERVFNQKIFRKLTTAAAVFEKIDAIIDTKDIRSLQYMQLLYCKPNYFLLSAMQYATLVTTAFRLTLFIEKRTSAFKSFYRRLQISNKQKMILVGAILMRLNCHLLTNTVDFEYNIPLKLDQATFVNLRQQIENNVHCIPAIREVVIDDIEHYYNIDEQREILKRSVELLQGTRPAEFVTPSSLPQLDHIKPCNSIHRPLSTYKDNIAEFYFDPIAGDFIYGDAAGVPMSSAATSLLCTRISKMSCIKRAMFVHHFATFFNTYVGEYFLQLKLRHNNIRQVLALLCTTLSKFRHSCAPNVEVVVLENGVVIGKTLRDVQKGEELVVSYKANYMTHTRDERKMFLRRLEIECRCNYCIMPQFKEPTNLRLGIYCDRCENVKITPDDGKCFKCRTSYNNLLLKYRSEMKILQNEINFKQKQNAGGRELYILHRICYLHARKHFTRCNEFCIRSELDYAQYLSLNNFAQQSYDVVMEVCSHLKLYYAEVDIWFTFYANILLIIKIILFYNIDEGLYSISTSSLKDLCDLGLYIVDGQKKHIIFYEVFDIESASILEDLHTFMEWNEKILYADFPLSNSFKKLSRQQNKKVMPRLSM